MFSNVINFLVKCFIITFIIILFANHTFAQSKTFLQIQNKFIKLIDSYNYSAALELKDDYQNIAEKEFTNNPKKLANAYFDIATLYKVVASYSKEIEYLNIISEIYKENEVHISYAKILQHRGAAYKNIGKYELAFIDYDESIEIFVNKLGKNSRELVKPYANYGHLLTKIGNYFESIDFYQQALELEELYLSEDNDTTANIYNHIAISFGYTNNYIEAEKFFLRAYEIRKNLYGEDHLQIANILNSLGHLYTLTENFIKAEEFILKSIDIRIKKLGENHPKTLLSKMNLSAFYTSQNNRKKSVQLLESIKDPMIEQFGYDHLEVIKLLSALANYYTGEGEDFEKAEKYALQSLNSAEKILDPLSTWISLNHHILSKAILYSPNLTIEKLFKAKEHAKSAAEISRKKIIKNSDLQIPFYDENPKNEIIEYITFLDAFSNHAKDKKQNLEDTFYYYQSINSLEASIALRKASVRLSNNNIILQENIKKLQDLNLENDTIYQKILNFNLLQLNQRDFNNEKLIKEKLISNKDVIKQIEIKLHENFPKYFELINTSILPSEKVQSLLTNNEALVGYLINDVSYDASDYFIWVLTKEDFKIYSSFDYHSDQIKNDIEILRNSLNPLNNQLFNYDIAHRIYSMFFQPIENIIQNKSHIYLVPSGDLFKLPFSVLITEDNYNGNYKNAPWLINKYAFSVLPSVSSLIFIKKKDKKNQSNRYLGFGDPVLENYNNDSFRGYFNKIQNINQLESLPDTRIELKTIASYLGENNGNIYLGAEATEAKIKSLNLQDYNTLIFATHALVSGELENLEEPGLVLTPPVNPSNENDGILTASEIVDLNLSNINLIILSACNTSAGSSSSSEELSGLAKSFFYAGGKSILVSHWPVASEITPVLTIGIFKNLLEHNYKISNSRALQLSILNYIEKMNENLAHPKFWAPFSFIGG